MKKYKTKIDFSESQSVFLDICFKIEYFWDKFDAPNNIDWYFEADSWKRIEKQQWIRIR